MSAPPPLPKKTLADVQRLLEDTKVIPPTTWPNTTAVHDTITQNLQELSGKSIPTMLSMKPAFNDPAWVSQAVQEHHVEDKGTNFSPKVWMLPNGMHHPRGVSHSDYYDYKDAPEFRYTGPTLEGLTPA